MRHIQEIDMNELIVANVNKYAKMLAEKKYLQSGYIAVREDDGIVITNPRIDYTDVKEENLTFVNDKNIETLEGNFRAAAVILFCAIRQDKETNAAAIVDSDSTVEFSQKEKNAYAYSRRYGAGLRRVYKVRSKERCVRRRCCSFRSTQLLLAPRGRRGRDGTYPR